jgi:hypothetical protein
MDTKRGCFVCGRRDATGAAVACAQCERAHYCSRTCAAHAWRALGHGALCQSFYAPLSVKLETDAEVRGREHLHTLVAASADPQVRALLELGPTRDARTLAARCRLVAERVLYAPWPAADAVVMEDSGTALDQVWQHLTRAMRADLAHDALRALRKQQRDAEADEHTSKWARQEEDTSDDHEAAPSRKRGRDADDEDEPRAAKAARPNPTRKRQRDDDNDDGRKRQQRDAPYPDPAPADRALPDDLAEALTPEQWLAVTRGVPYKALRAAMPWATSSAAVLRAYVYRDLHQQRVPEDVPLDKLRALYFGALLAGAKRLAAFAGERPHVVVYAHATGGAAALFVVTAERGARRAGGWKAPLPPELAAAMELLALDPRSPDALGEFFYEVLSRVTAHAAAVDPATRAVAAL